MTVDEGNIAFFTAQIKKSPMTLLWECTIYNGNVQTVRQLSTATVLVWTVDIMCLQYNMGILILQVNWVT